MDNRAIILLSKEFYNLSKNLLKYANMGMPVVEYLIKLSEELQHFTDCQSIGIVSSGSQFNYYWQYDKNGSKSFELCQRRDITCSNLPDDMAVVVQLLLNHKRSLNGDIITINDNIYIPDLDKDYSIFYENKEYNVHFDSKNKSLLMMRFDIDDMHKGIIMFWNQSRFYFTDDEIEFYESIVPTIGVAIANRRAQHALRERIKEMTCMYGISRILADDISSRASVMKRVISLIPPAFQFPEYIRVEVEIDKKKYYSEKFEKSNEYISADIIENGRKRGYIGIYHVYNKKNDIVYFLDEESDLLNTLASQIALIIEKERSLDEKIRLETQLRHADRLATIGQLAAGVAHELNEPLGSILGFAQLMRNSYELTENAKNDLEKIIKGSLHAREIIKKLMLFAKQMPPKKDYVNINTLIEESIYFLEKRIRDANASVETKFAERLPSLIADSSQLYQVMVNLIVNALQAMPEGGIISIVSREDNGQIIIDVKDTGIGIPKSIQDKIFLPFFTTKDVNEGTGLGLPVVHGIISAHKGEIKVKSKKHNGSTFTVKLPVKMEPDDV